MLTRQPGNYNALSKIIQILRRSGKAPEIKSLLEEVEQ